MDSGRLRERARKVGLEVKGPYTGGVYALFESSSGKLLADRLTPDEIAALIQQHVGVPRLADMRRRRQS